jgi:hypothetical protein
MSSSREQLLADIRILNAQQMESSAKATCGAWTAQEEAEHGERAARLARLVAELQALDSAVAS